MAKPMLSPQHHHRTKMRQKPLIIVIKLGTSSIIDEKTHQPLLDILSLIVKTTVQLRKDGHKVVIVSSGAIGVGLQKMKLDKRPKHLPRVQALAAIGQCKLMTLWDSLFSHLDQPIAQILLTRGDIADRTQYINAQNTLSELLEMGVIPIVNENDTIAVSEIKFGDNDTLSAITAAMVHADYLFLMTDVDCLYDKNPRVYPEAKAIEVVEDIAALQADVSSAGSILGTGGMSTKITAARLATAAGVTTVIARSSNPGNIINILNYTPMTNPNSSEPATTMKAPLHTRFVPSVQPIRDRYFWLLNGLVPHGAIFIDEGAHLALSQKAGLLPVGIVDVEGTFAQHECVNIAVVDRAALSDITASPSRLWTGTPRIVGRAISNYSATEVMRIKGIKSTQIASLLGYADSEYVALRENISFFHEDRKMDQQSEIGNATFS